MSYIAHAGEGLGTRLGSTMHMHMREPVARQLTAAVIVVGLCTGIQLCISISVSLSAHFLLNRGSGGYMQQALSTERVWSSIVKEQHVYREGLNIQGVHFSRKLLWIPNIYMDRSAGHSKSLGGVVKDKYVSGRLILYSLCMYV